MKTVTLLSVAGMALTAQAAIIGFDAFDHPDGSVNPQGYGLRLDQFAGETPATFSFEDGMGNSRVTVIINTDIGGGVAALTMQGVVWGNSAAGGTVFGDYFLAVAYTGTYNSVTGLFTATAAGANIGTLTATNVTGGPLANGQSLNLFAQARGDGTTFEFGRGFPGARLPGNDPRSEGQGWLESAQSNGTEDFLFTAVFNPDVPTPGAAGLLALGGLVATRRRR